MMQLDLFDALPYEDYITVVRLSEPDTADGIFRPASVTTVLASACDVQDDVYHLRRSLLGDEAPEADAAVYLPLTPAINLVRVGDRVTVDQSGVVREGRVTAVSLYDCKLYVAWA